MNGDGIVATFVFSRQKYKIIPYFFLSISTPPSLATDSPPPVHPSSFRNASSDRSTAVPNKPVYSLPASWTGKQTGRLGMGYRYSVSIVYNNFPWIEDITEDQKGKIEKTAQAILDARALYPNNTLAELYDDAAMPIELRKAHNANDKEVLKLYGMKTDIEESVSPRRMGRSR